MYFIAEHFRLLPNAKDREIAANIANNAIIENGFAVCGRYLKDETLSNWSTENNVTDTHSGILIDIRPMGGFKPEASMVKTEESKLREELDAYKRLAAQQELEIRRKDEAKNEK